jgi:hypothetical protein
MNERKKYFGTRQVRARYGDKCQRTIDRWIDSQELGVPKPTIINGRRFWDEADLIVWERERAVGAAL